MARFVEEDMPLVRAATGEAPPLKPVSVRPSFFTYLRQLWGRRHFIKMQSWAMAMNQHQGTLLGNLWLIVAPVIDGFIYYLVFGYLIGGAGRIENFFGYVVIGIFLFTFTARSVTNSSKCIDSGRGLIRAFNFPRAALPIATVWREVIALLPVIYALIILLLVVPPKAKLSWWWLLLPVVLLIQFVFNLGLGLIAARIGNRYPDIRHLLPYFVRIWLYASCVMYGVDRFERFPPLDVVVEANPIYQVLTITREILLYNAAPPLDAWWKLSARAVGLLLVGIVFFWQAEVKYARRAHE